MESGEVARSVIVFETLAGQGRDGYFACGDSVGRASPVTGQTYTMACSNWGQVTCRGGNNAMVRFAV